MQKETSNIIINFNDKDNSLIDDLSNYLDIHLDDIYNFFDVSKEKPIINIISTKLEFDNNYKKIKNLDYNYEVPKWVVGLSHDNEIDFLSLNDYQNTSHNPNLEEYKKTLLHECIHYVNGLFCQKYNVDYSIKCLSEGIATYLSKQKINVTSFTLDDLLNNSNCYYGWYLITKYILENNSHEFFLDLLKDNKKAKEYIKEIYKVII